MAMQFPVYFWLGAWQIHPHFLFESLAYAIAYLGFRFLINFIKPDFHPF